MYAAADTPGLMSSFDPNRPYSWLFVNNPTGAVVDINNNPTVIEGNHVTHLAYPVLKKS